MTGFIPAPIKPEITMDHLEKIDVRVGVVERVELVPASNKLVKLTVDFGDCRRTVLAGLRRERADPNSLLKNPNSSAFVLRFSSSYKRSVRFSSECSRLVATLSL